MLLTSGFFNQPVGIDGPSTVSDGGGGGGSKLFGGAKSLKAFIAAKAGGGKGGVSGWLGSCVPYACRSTDLPLHLRH